MYSNLENEENENLELKNINVEDVEKQLISNEKQENIELNILENRIENINQTKSKFQCLNFFWFYDRIKIRKFLPNFCISIFKWLQTPKIKKRIKYSIIGIILLFFTGIISYLISQDIRRLISLFGLCIFLIVCYFLSKERKSISWRPILWGLVLQFILGLIVLYTKLGFSIFEWLGNSVIKFLQYSEEGSKFVFGNNIKDFYVAFVVLPTIIFFSSFISIMYYFGIIQLLTKIVAWVMIKTLGTSGAESLNCSANIFVGMTESPLVIKSYIESMTLSELHAVMTSGFATIAGSVMVAYISFGISAVHLLSASLMSAPASLAIAKLLYPELEEPVTKGLVKIQIPKTEVNIIDAAAMGALNGGKLAANVLCMLIAFLSLVAFLNGILGAIGDLIHVPQLSMEWLLGYLLSPVAWLLGVPWNDCLKVGSLLGKKTILNEFVAYLELKNLVDKGEISKRAEIIATYALCGFSNFGAVGTTIGGIGAICPQRQKDLAKLGIRALFAGTIASFITANIAGILL